MLICRLGHILIYFVFICILSFCGIHRPHLWGLLLQPEKIDPGVIQELTFFPRRNYCFTCGELIVSTGEMSCFRMGRMSDILEKVSYILAQWKVLKRELHPMGFFRISHNWDLIISMQKGSTSDIYYREVILITIFKLGIVHWFERWCLRNVSHTSSHWSNFEYLSSRVTLWNQTTALLDVFLPLFNAFSIRK